MNPRRFFTLLALLLSAAWVPGQSPINWRYAGTIQTNNFSGAPTTGYTPKVQADGSLAYAEDSAGGGGLPGTNSVVAYGDAQRTNLLQVTSGGVLASNANGSVTIAGGTVTATNFVGTVTVPTGARLTNGVIYVADGEQKVVIEGGEVALTLDEVANIFTFDSAVSALSFSGDGSGLTGITPGTGVKTNGTTLHAAATNINFVAGANTTVTGAVSGASVTIGISSTGGTGTTYTNDTGLPGVVSGSSIGTNLTTYATLTAATNAATVVTNASGILAITAEQTNGAYSWPTTTASQNATNAGNIAFLDADNIFTGTSNRFTGDVAVVGGLTGSNATVNTVTATSWYPGITNAPFLGTTAAGKLETGTNATLLKLATNNAADLTQLNATALSSGTVADARLPDVITSDVTGNSATSSNLLADVNGFASVSDSGFWWSNGVVSFGDKIVEATTFRGALTGNATTATYATASLNSTNCYGNATTATYATASLNSTNCYGNATTATSAVNATNVYGLVAGQETWTWWAGPTNTLVLNNKEYYFDCTAVPVCINALTVTANGGTWAILTLRNTNAATAIAACNTRANVGIMGTAAYTANTNNLSIAAGKSAVFSFSGMSGIRTNFSNAVQQ